MIRKIKSFLHFSYTVTNSDDKALRTENFMYHHITLKTILLKTLMVLAETGSLMVILREAFP